MSDDEALESQAGVKAVETAARLLVAMRESRGPEMLKDIAARADMHPAKAHRYLTSLVRAGLVAKDEVSGLYKWGPLTIDIGASAIRNTSLVRVGVQEIQLLRDKIDVTVALAVWGTFGPTHIVVEEANRAIITKSQIGSVLPLLNSATGRIFAAFLQTPEVERKIAEEIRDMAKSNAHRSEIAANFNELCIRIRAEKIAQALGDYYSGIIALSCPVFDHRNILAGAITVLSHQHDFDPSIDGQVAMEVREASRRLSRHLGHLPD